MTVTCVPLQAILLGLRAEAGLFPEICWVTLDRWPFHASVSSSLKQRNLPEPSVLWPTGPSAVGHPSLLNVASVATSQVSRGPSDGCRAKDMAKT